LYIILIANFIFSNLFYFIYIYIMNRLDDTFQSELLESLIVLQNTYKDYEKDGRVVGLDVSELEKAFVDAYTECTTIMDKIRGIYNSITYNDCMNAIENITERNQNPENVIKEFNDIINRGTITARGKRKRIKRKTHKNSKRIKRNSKRIKRKSHRRSYRIKKM